MVGMGMAGEKNGVGVGHGSPWSGGVLQMVEAGAARWAFSSPNPCTDAAVGANWRISRSATQNKNLASRELTGDGAS